MKYINSFENHNEGIKSNIAKATLLGSLLISSPKIHSIDIDRNTNKIEQISNIIEKKDDKLEKILKEIKENLYNNDSTKYLELYDKLSKHVKNKYGYEFKKKDLDTFDKEKTKNSNNIIELIGWISSICFAICALPQALHSFLKKTSDGVNLGMLLLWIFGELFGTVYAIGGLGIGPGGMTAVLPLLFNYSFNIFLVGLILYYKAIDAGKIKKSKTIDIEIKDIPKELYSKVKKHLKKENDN